MRVQIGFRAAVAVGMCVAGSAAFGIDLNHTDTFSDGSNMDWGGGSPPVNIAGGGPGGLSDAFIQQTSSGGSGSNSRMATENASARWVGDYRAAGVTGLEADFLNRGNVPLQMRAVLFSGRSNRMTSTNAGLVPADGLWHHVVFGITSNDMTIVSGSLSYPQIINNVDNLMFRHDSDSPSSGGTAVQSVLGIDNIHPVPTPGATGIFAASGVALLRRRRRGLHA